MEDNDNQITVVFEEDTEYSVSLETATAMMTIVGAPSIEALIHNALVQFMKTLEIAYPKEDEISTSEHWANVARWLPNGITLRVLSGLFSEEVVNATSVGNEYTLRDLISDVNEENKHERISFGHPVGKELL
ncbi:MAG: AbrB/MazE/SpoVT family DNA-binding domain-containing protein [Methylophilus sp.]|uniref:AbrB/MazE/SpoVT family DNA-binding domain-containing protein n=1 Tax=Methylophilus sp. TaxID=29541 RepID=UPI0040372860